MLLLLPLGQGRAYSTRAAACATRTARHDRGWAMPRGWTRTTTAHCGDRSGAGDGLLTAAGRGYEYHHGVFEVWQPPQRGLLLRVPVARVFTNELRPRGDCIVAETLVLV